ncbi:MAG: phosphoesterase [Planctomycetota bacterium]|mgnify:CR=1 FL=1|nr:MAG: phosphoesterase [Planctomycetota bacterium]REJ97782.1 MAG: phosphoesterase [Planctomycetota bacterium]REK17837.1 MAG: phosphoesterase [Planctomycetota bacterium]REK49229.1 MAG: phosphoesterase [Planctomycetota bacterium]
MATRVVWITDPHFNFLSNEALAEFVAPLAADPPAAVLIGGDIGEADSVADYLQILERALTCPVYFVLGNHDFYGGSIRRVRAAVTELAADAERLGYLTATDVVKLAEDVALVGHDGWADGRLGDYENSDVMLNDYRLIQELASVDKVRRLPLLQQLGDEAADHLRRTLTAALEDHPRAFVLTHVPPLREACWHEGRLSNDEWLPHFTCQAAGEALLEVAGQFPDRQVTVLCGHTHSRGEVWPLANLQILTGAAEYRQVAVEKVFEL